ncbi:MAG: histidine phosphotransferase family protein [Sulfitobacter sp.]
MSVTNAQLAALLSSRICHDLISPIGAINNGIELLGLSGHVSPNMPEIELINQSAANASARIRFFRIAYGAAGDQMIRAEEIRDIVKNHYAGGRISAVWEGSEPQPRRALRLAFLALQCLETALPLGGRIDLFEQEGQWTLCASGEKLQINDDLWKLLDGTPMPDDLLPGHVQFALLPIFAAENNEDIRVQREPDQLSIRF